MRRRRRRRKRKKKEDEKKTMMKKRKRRRRKTEKYTKRRTPPPPQKKTPNKQKPKAKHKTTKGKDDDMRLTGRVDCAHLADRLVPPRWRVRQVHVPCHALALSTQASLTSSTLLLSSPIPPPNQQHIKSNNKSQPQPYKRKKPIH